LDNKKFIEKLHKFVNVTFLMYKIIIINIYTISSSLSKSNVHIVCKQFDGILQGLSVHCSTGLDLKSCGSKSFCILNNFNFRHACTEH